MHSTDDGARDRWTAALLAGPFTSSTAPGTVHAVDSVHGVDYPRGVLGHLVSGPYPGHTEWPEGVQRSTTGKRTETPMASELLIHAIALVGAEGLEPPTSAV